MSNEPRNDHTGRSLALVGGSAVLVWLFLRGKGFGLGAGNGVGVAAAAGTTNTNTTSVPGAPPCQVFIRSSRIDLDGATADLPTVINRCGAAGKADVRATGDAIVGTIGRVVEALQAAGVRVSASPDVWNTAKAMRSRKP